MDEAAAQCCHEKHANSGRIPAEGMPPKMGREGLPQGNWEKGAPSHCQYNESADLLSNSTRLELPCKPDNW